VTVSALDGPAWIDVLTGSSRAMTGPEVPASRVREASEALRAAAGVVGVVVEDVAHAESSAVGCRAWTGQAAEAEQHRARRFRRLGQELADCLTAAADGLRRLSDDTARAEVLARDLRERAISAELTGDVDEGERVRSRYADVMNRWEAECRRAAATVAVAAEAVPAAGSWSVGAGSAPATEQWREAVRALGDLAWEAGPGTLATALRWSPLGWLGAYDGAVTALEDARVRLHELGGATGSGSTYWSVYGVGAVGMAVVPGPVGKRPAVTAAGVLPGDDVARAGDDLAGVRTGGGPPGRPGDGWTGPNGLRLTPEQDRAVTDLHLRATAAEGRLTGRLEGASRVTGVELGGLEHRLKALESLRRKVAARLEDAPGADLDEVLAGLNDVVRFTFVAGGPRYADDVDRVARTLEVDGFQPLAWRSSWGGEGYQGINSTWRDPATGQVFEIQFHTPQSWYAKESTHHLYEERRLGVDESRRADLTRIEDEAFSRVTAPPMVSSIRNPTVPDAGSR
jgi:hypothetical protein